MQTRTRIYKRIFNPVCQQYFKGIPLAVPGERLNLYFETKTSMAIGNKDGHKGKLDRRNTQGTLLSHLLEFNSAVKSYISEMLPW